MPPKPIYTAEEMLIRHRRQRAEWEKRNPEKVAEKRRRDRERKNLAKAGKLDQTHKTCKTCGLLLPVSRFKVVGTGLRSECITCRPNKSLEEIRAIRREEAKRYRAKYPDKVNELDRKRAEKKRLLNPKSVTTNAAPKKAKPVPVKKITKQTEPFPLTFAKPKPTTYTSGTMIKKAREEGWMMVCGFGEWNHGMIAFIRGPLIMFQTLGGLKTYGVLFDDNGSRYLKLHQAEALAKRMAI